jgi:hypothetical protein
MDGFLRLGFGEEPEYLRAALERVAAGLAELGVREMVPGAAAAAAESSLRSPR